MGDARGLFINSLNVEDASSSTEAPNAGNLTNNQEVDKPLGIIEANEKPETGGVHPSPKKEIKEIPPQAQELIGIIICKVCCGVSYLGTVVDYNVDRKWFRIEYDDDGSEDMEEQDVRNYIASNEQIQQHLKRLRRVERKQKRVSGKGSTPKKPRRKGMDISGRRADGTYIPLVYRTTKKDDYYWY